MARRRAEAVEPAPEKRFLSHDERNAMLLAERDLAVSHAEMLLAIERTRGASLKAQLAEANGKIEVAESKGADKAASDRWQACARLHSEVVRSVARRYNLDVATLAFVPETGEIVDTSTQG